MRGADPENKSQGPARPSPARRAEPKPAPSHAPTPAPARTPSREQAPAPAPVPDATAQAHDRLARAMARTSDPSGLLPTLAGMKDVAPDTWRRDYEDLFARYAGELGGDTHPEYRAFRAQADKAVGFKPNAVIGGAGEDGLFLKQAAEDGDAPKQSPRPGRKRPGEAQTDLGRRWRAAGHWVDEAVTEGASDVVIDDSAPLTLDDLRERYPDLPENLTPEASRKVFGQLKPGKTVLENHRTYETIDALLQSTPGAIKSQFFKAAQEVTSWNGLGSMDGVSLLKDETEAYLLHVHHGLVPYNLEAAKSLLAGKELEGMEGLRGKDLDYALVQREQLLVQKLTDAFFKNHPALDRDAILKDAGDASAHNPAGFLGQPDTWLDPRNDYVEKSFDTGFSESEYDMRIPGHRMKVGRGMIDEIYDLRQIPWDAQ